MWGLITSRACLEIIGIGTPSASGSRMRMAMRPALPFPATKAPARGRLPPPAAGRVRPGPGGRPRSGSPWALRQIEEGDDPADGSLTADKLPGEGADHASPVEDERQVPAQVLGV